MDRVNQRGLNLERVVLTQTLQPVPFPTEFSQACKAPRGRKMRLFRLKSYSASPRIVYFRYVALTPRSRSAIGNFVCHDQAVALSREAEGGKDSGRPLPHSRS